MEDSALSLGRTRSATAANERVWSVTPHSRARTSGSAPRSGNRVVANTDQVYALKQFLERAGLDATTKEIEAVAGETGLDGKWIRHWIKRQVNGNRGKSKKGKKLTGSSTGDTSAQTSRGASPDGPFTPLVPQMVANQEVASTGNAARKFSFVAVEGFEAGSNTRQHSGQSATGSYGGFVSSPATGYDWKGIVLSHGSQDGSLRPQAHSSLVHTADQGASFMVPFRPEATYQPTAAVPPSSPHINATQWTDYKTAQPRSIREAEFFASAVRTASQYLNAGGSYTSSGISTEAFHATAPGPASQNPAVPDCLTASSAYLYRLFHERLADAPPVAPPVTPQLDSEMYMAGLTRPSWMTDGTPLSSATLLPASASMFSPVTGYATYPVAYPMRFCDLVQLTKTVRGDTKKEPGPSTSTLVPCQTTEKPQNGDGDEILTDSIVPTQSDFLRVVIRAASLDTTQEGGETEDEHEAVTPCDGADLALRSDTGKGKGREQEKPTVSQVAIVDGADAGTT